MTCRPQETGILPISHRTFADRKTTHPDPVHRLLILLTEVSAHEKIAGWDRHQIGFKRHRRVLSAES
jgi:hypothetical protein